MCVNMSKFYPLEVQVGKTLIIIMRRFKDENTV